MVGMATREWDGLDIGGDIQREVYNTHGLYK